MIKESLYTSAVIQDYELFRCPVTLEMVSQSEQELATRNGEHRYKLYNGIPDFAPATIKGNLKQNIQGFWDNCPNESSVSKGAIGSPKFFTDTEDHRYRLHKDFDNPFLKQAVGFDNVVNQRVLEVGCGIGMDTIQFARNGNDIYILDLSLNSVLLTLSRLQNEGYKAHACIADAENLPLESNSFDIAYSYGVLHHTPNTHRCVQEVFRVLKPGGKAIIMLYAKYSAMTIFQVGLHYGIRKGELFRLKSWDKLLSRWTELQSKTEDSINPLTQTFTKKQCQKMFAEFSSIQMGKHYLTNNQFAELRLLLKITPAFVIKLLPGLLGWNIIIHAVK